jgi:8-amino-7-oxononanoate synthase
VPEKSARLRFFVSCQHTEAEIEHTIKTVAELM